MKKITINLSFYNQNKVLVDQVESWKSWTKDIRDQFSFCIADDCSKVPAMEVLENVDMSDIDLSVYRVNEDLYCNIAGVRNLSAQECKTEWMVILDMDTFVSEELATSMLKLASTRTGEAYKFNRRVVDPKHPKNGQPHPAVCLLRVEDYWNVGGCEEDLVGHYGWTDPSFWYRSIGKLHVVTFSDLYLDYCPEGEADIDRDNSHNYRLHEEKKHSGNWSTDFVRFKWKKVY
tara:strand:+ start:10109 stop:10804 length:696 start_codon:yes stop_codon:yes gene_type:complete